MRTELLAGGLDAGAASIAWHLKESGYPPPTDFTHWRLKDNTDVEIINWPGDHSRLLLHSSVYKAITSKIVIDTFLCLSKRVWNAIFNAHR